VWLSDALAALPRTGPQIVFALLMLAAGLAAGRASRSLSGAHGEPDYEDGAGI
jgi:hypothetical protein